MGGSLFRNVGMNTVRLPAQRALALADEILPALHDLERSVGIELTPAQLIPAYRSKPDFGDLDFLISDRLVAAIGDAGIRDGLRDRLGIEMMSRRPHASDPTFALALSLRSGETFQVDLITTADDAMDFALGFLSWGDVGSYMGRVARQMGLRFGQSGLHLLLSHTDGTRVPISTDRDAAIKFMGFDPVAHRAGFDTPEEIYDFIAAGRFFDPAIFEMERMTNKARQRVKKRTFYPPFIEEIRKRPARHSWPITISPEAALYWREQAFDAFPGAREAHADVLSQVSRKSAAREFFSGERVSRITGVHGERLEHLMNAVRKHFETPEDFIAWTELLDEADLKRRLRAAMEEGYMPSS